MIATSSRRSRVVATIRLTWSRRAAAGKRRRHGAVARPPPTVLGRQIARAAQNLKDCTLTFSASIA
jgi:hypothetical protein